jgi:filamentous hemagglutinin
VDSLLATRAGAVRLLLNQGARNFATGEKAIEHFAKHGSGLMRALGRDSYNLANYLDDANFVVQNGKWVPELNGYVRLIGGPGSAKAAFVGVDRITGALTTFHVKTVEFLSKVAPSLGWIK